MNSPINNDATPDNLIYNPDLKDLKINIDNFYKTKDLSNIRRIKQSKRT